MFQLYLLYNIFAYVAFLFSVQPTGNEGWMLPFFLTTPLSDFIHPDSIQNCTQPIFMNKPVFSVEEHIVRLIKEIQNFFAAVMDVFCAIGVIWSLKGWAWDRPQSYSLAHYYELIGFVSSSDIPYTRSTNVTHSNNFVSIYGVFTLILICSIFE